MFTQMAVAFQPDDDEITCRPDDNEITCTLSTLARWSLWAVGRQCYLTRIWDFQKCPL